MHLAEAAAVARHAQTAIVSHYAQRLHARFILTLEALIKRYEAELWMEFSNEYERLVYVYGKLDLQHESMILFAIKKVAEKYMALAAALGYERGLRDLITMGWLKWYQQPVNAPKGVLDSAREFNDSYLNTSFGPAISRIKPGAMHARITQYAHYLWRVADGSYRQCMIDFRTVQRHKQREGGIGSGNFGHAGRPGERGGSTGTYHLDWTHAKNVFEDKLNPSLVCDTCGAKFHLDDPNAATHGHPDWKMSPHPAQFDATRWVLVGGKPVPLERVREAIKEVGGPGSGDYGHKGRPGERGGSTLGDKLAQANAENQAFYDSRSHDQALVERTAQYIDNNKEYFNSTEQRLQQLFPDATVSGRQKSLASAVTKLETNPKWNGDPSNLPDVNAIRITNSLDTFNEIETKLRENFNVAEEKNYIEHERDDAYRAVHFIIDDGTHHAEIQVRTPYQTTWADWQWGYYKKIQQGAVPHWWQNYSDTITDYSKRMSDYFFAQDRGLRDIPKPECIEEIRITIGCL